MTPVGNDDKMIDEYRNVAAIVVALALTQAATGAISIVGPLTLIAQGASTLIIGAIASSYALGFVLGARMAPAEIRQIGHIRAFALFAAGGSLAAAGLYLSTHTAWWMLMQALIGMSVAGLLASGESWIAGAAPAARRGAVLGFYLVTSKLGFMAGPFLAAYVSPGSAAGFLIVSALFTASLIPVSATRRAEPPLPSAEPFGPLRLWKTAPSAVIAAFIAGIVNGAVLQLYALFVADLSPGSAATMAAMFNAAMIGGAVLSQWPAGVISDNVDRRVVIAALASVSGVAAVLLAIFAMHLPLSVVFVLAGIWGAGSLSYYGVAVAHAADRAGQGEATNMMSGILMIWATGSMIGPALAGGVMSAAGSGSLFMFAAIGLFVLALAMLYRRVGTAQVADFDKGEFSPSLATSLAAADLNPMSDGDEDADTETSG
ncbi:MFS transporter [uncultured Maricaulis sp.]|uniref:MFS transporter n=1 Tax=uncultured Maricaulis sp. TaxID=174710 RepID=UPI0030D71678|tara:strand:- start:11952 stop:13244 length:1293 start_codon:yes stop_codon:yes gene_type:complete